MSLVSDAEEDIESIKKALVSLLKAVGTPKSQAQGIVDGIDILIEGHQRLRYAKERSR